MDVFLKILNMSISASWLILAVFLVRLLLKKAPKWINCVLWALVAVRLLCPFSFESSLSLVPNAEPIPQELFVVEPPEIHDSPIFDPVTNPNLPDTPPVVADTSIDRVQISTMFATFGWAAGIAAMLLYAAISYILLRRKVRASLHLRDNIWICDDIQSPFILGTIKPRIYIPSGTDEAQITHVIAHENAHLKRRDHWWKPLGFLVLAIHWFNPLVWVAYIFLCRDIEMACDEKVVRDMDSNESIEYSEALLACSINRKTIMVCPLAFGEVGVKERVKRVLNYKKPAFWIIIAAVIACVVLAVCLLTNPANTVDAKMAVFLDCQIASFHQSEHSKDNFCCLDWEIVGKEKDGDQTTLYMWVMYKEYANENGLALKAGAHIFTVITARWDGENYQLVEYWQPEDGADHVDSIKEKVPMYLWGKAAHSQWYNDKQAEALEKMAKEYFGITESNSENNGLMQFNQPYGVVEVTYESPVTSFSMVAQVNTPEYMFDKNFHLFSVREYSEAPDWTDLGKISEITITKENFDELFRNSSGEGWSNRKSAASIRRNTVKAWSVIYDQEKLYYILQQKNGEFFLAYGYYDYSEKDDPGSDDTYIRWLYRLAPLGSPVGSSATIWFDYLKSPEEMHWDGRLEIDIPEFPNVTFRWYPEKIEAVTENESIPILSGMPIWNCYFSDLTGDGKPEICVTSSFGSGMIDERVQVYDYANGQHYVLEDRGTHDYVLVEGNGSLLVHRYSYPRREDSLPDAIGVLHIKDGKLSMLGGFDATPQIDTTVAELVPGTSYVSWQCLYMNPLSSYFAAGGDSGCRYIVTEDEFVIMDRSHRYINQSTGKPLEGNEAYLQHQIVVSKWEWQEFPYTDEEWAALYKPSTGTDFKISEVFDEILYQPLAPARFLLRVDGDLWLVELSANPQMGPYIWSIYSLIPEVAMGSAQWEFTNYNSRSPVFRFEFDMDYDEISAVCTESKLVDFNGTNESGSNMTVPTGKCLYWSPVNENGAIVSDADIHFSVHKDDKTIYCGTIYISRDKEADGVHPLYTASIVGTGLHLAQNSESEGGIISAVADSIVK